jgi:hypothetical protein
MPFIHPPITSAHLQATRSATEGMPTMTRRRQGKLRRKKRLLTALGLLPGGAVEVLPPSLADPREKQQRMHVEPSHEPGPVIAVNILLLSA